MRSVTSWKIYVYEEHRDLALDSALRLIVRTLEQLTQDVIAHVAAECALDALLLFDRIPHLVERAGQFAHLVARRGRHTDGEIPGRELFDSSAEPTQGAHEQGDEGDPREHTEHHHGNRGGRELLGAAAHDGIDQHGQVELDVRFTDAHAAVEDRGRDQKPLSIARYL
jgi:hypothetical protein